MATKKFNVGDFVSSPYNATRSERIGVVTFISRDIYTNKLVYHIRILYMNGNLTTRIAPNIITRTAGQLRPYTLKPSEHVKLYLLGLVDGPIKKKEKVKAG